MRNNLNSLRNQLVEIHKDPRLFGVARPLKHRNLLLLRAVNDLISFFDCLYSEDEWTDQDFADMDHSWKYLEQAVNKYLTLSDK